MSWDSVRSEAGRGSFSVRDGPRSGEISQSVSRSGYAVKAISALKLTNSDLKARRVKGP